MKDLRTLRILFMIASVLNLSTIEGPGQRPNVLLIISDDLNTRIGPYMEIDKHTPNLDRLAAQGVRFTRTYCQYPLCGPSRASLMSGLYCETNGVMGNDYTLGSYRKKTPELSDHPSLAGFFREQGYYTARVSKIFHMGVPGGIERGEPGGDDPDSWDYAYNVLGPETLSDGILELLSPGNLHYGSNFSRMILENELEVTQTDYLTASQAIAILENRTGSLPPNGTNAQKLKPDAPFFLAVGLVRPHVPLIAPEYCFEPYPEQDMEIPPVVIGDNVPWQALVRRNINIWKMGEMQKRKTISAYMASVRFMDQQVGRILDALDRLQIREETIVVFISDHGYNLGEHDCWSKVSLWEGSVRIPMIISHPGAPDRHGKTSDRITELVDLYPTLTELCGMAELQPSILQGKSLARCLTVGASPGNDDLAYTTTNGGKDASIRTDRWRYTRWSEPAPPENEETSSGNDIASPENIETSSVNDIASPENVEASPENVEASPENKETTPENLKAVSGNEETTPEQVKASTGGQEIPPGVEELYDHENDPEELVNLADDPDYEVVLQEMRQKFEKARELVRSGLPVLQH